MTEAGRKWVAEQKASGDILRYASPSAEIAAEFWISAFCYEVDARAQLLAGEQPGHDPNFVDYSTAFGELKRELLGESTE